MSTFNSMPVYYNNEEKLGNYYFDKEKLQKALGFNVELKKKQKVSFTITFTTEDK